MLLASLRKISHKFLNKPLLLSDINHLTGKTAVYLFLVFLLGL